MTPSTNIFLNRLANIKPKVWKLLKTYLPNKSPKFHYEMVREYPLRQGKYFRPGLLVLGAELFGSTEEKALPLAVAMQLSEEWLLVHDDIEDHSETRRRTLTKLNPTLNVMYGDELAINAGDALHILMWEALGDAMRGVRRDRGWIIFEKMKDILLKTTEGQSIELEWIRSGKIEITEKDYYEMIYRKAGYYTVTGPIQLGAIVASAGNDEVRNIERWGVPFGSAFQIWDDVLNVIGDERVTGKETGGDIAEGKRTILLIHLLRLCGKREKKQILEIYRKKRNEKKQSEISFVIDLMHRYESTEYAKKQALRCAKLAERHLLESRGYVSRGTIDIIVDAIRFVVNRSN